MGHGSRLCPVPDATLDCADHPPNHGHDRDRRDQQREGIPGGDHDDDARDEPECGDCVMSSLLSLGRGELHVYLASIRGHLPISGRLPERVDHEKTAHSRVMVTDFTRIGDVCDSEGALT